MQIKILIITIVLALSASLFAQTEVSPTPLPPTEAAQPAAASPQAQGMEKMDKMADSVTKMSEMCQTMMQKEMATMHYKIAAGVTIISLFTIALVLLVILQIQWIIYWARLLREQKQRSTS